MHQVLNVPLHVLADMLPVVEWRKENDEAWDLIIEQLLYVPPAVVTKSKQLLSSPYAIRALLRAVRRGLVKPDMMIPTVIERDRSPDDQALISLIHAGGVDHRLCPGLPDQTVVDLLLRMAKVKLDSVRLAGIEMEDFGALLEELASGERPPVTLGPSPAITDWEVPMLNARLQVESVPSPEAWVKWGTRARDSSLADHLVHFYTHDRKFVALTDDPRAVIRSDPMAVVEPNFSMADDMPLPIALYRTYQKRWLSSLWQQFGIRVLVDMNVPDRWFDMNLHGVPVGWKAYANRGYRDDLAHLERGYECARAHAESSDILYVVYSGGNQVKALCERRGWHWIPDQAQTVKNGAATKTVHRD